MMQRTLGMLLGIAVATLTVACGDATGTADLHGGYVPYDTSSSTSGTDPGAANGAANGGSAAGGAAADGGEPLVAAADGGAAAHDAAGAASSPTGAFAGAPAYVATTGPSTIKGDHSAFPGSNPAKQACLGCHQFTVGGSVFKDAAGTIPAASVEMRFIDANGAAHSAYTDVNGNFYLNAGALVGPAKVGVRDGVNTHLMAGGITSGNCNSSSCHGGAQGFIHLP